MGEEKVASQDPVDQLRADLQASEAKAQDLMSRMKYAQAEVENTRKEAEKRVAEQVRDTRAYLIHRLLPILDEFDLALRSMKIEAGGLASGVLMIRNNLLAALRAEGLEEIGTGGKFDPFVHEAVADVEVEGMEAGTIVDIVQKGYRLGARVLRPAQVVVARGEPLARKDFTDEAPERDEG